MEGLQVPRAPPRVGAGLPGFCPGAPGRHAPRGWPGSLVSPGGRGRVSRGWPVVPCGPPGSNISLWQREKRGGGVRHI